MISKASNQYIVWATTVRTMRDLNETLSAVLSPTWRGARNTQRRQFAFMKWRDDLDQGS